ncbi:MAG: hypothetical protein LBS30_01455 [Planctomycetota bacterium]|jgi:DNA-directed RNA polymerase subunit M/transcription elongation factor TFIIS|nr:hypothetical protein [Planctomycetota bacterium]
MRTLFILSVLMCVPVLWTPPVKSARAAEFDLDSGRVVLRQLQYCVDCGAALLVTQVPAGVMVRCPDCGREQPRLAQEYLLTQMYQLCKVCQSPLNPEGHTPGEVVECGTCRARQPLTGDVFARGEHADGLGYVPGFPPGTGKKTLLLSPNRPETRITTIPLDDGLPDQPSPPAPGQAARMIPAPPEKIPADNISGRDAAPRPSPDAEQASGPVDVPSVTADLFGKQRASAAAPAPDPAPDPASSLAAARAFYAQHKNEMMRPRAVALDQLVVYEDRLGKQDGRNYRDIALEISGLLESGEKFDALRERYDEFLPGAGVERVAPRLQPVGAYAPQVAAAGGELRKGAVFGPLFMEGMALFGKVVDERPEEPIPFAEVEGEIRSRLEASASGKNVDALLQRLRDKARMEGFE